MQGLKRFLLENRQDQFARAMVHKLTSYALGRPLSFADRSQVEDITANLRRQDDGLNIGRVDFLEPEAPMAVPTRFGPLLTLLDNILTELEPQYRFIEKNFEDAGWVGCRLAEVLPLSLEQKQMFLELSDPLKRLEMLMPLVESLRA